MRTVQAYREGGPDPRATAMVVAADPRRRAALGHALAGTGRSRPILAAPAVARGWLAASSPGMVVIDGDLPSPTIYRLYSAVRVRAGDARTPIIFVGGTNGANVNGAIRNGAASAIDRASHPSVRSDTVADYHLGADADDSALAALVDRLLTPMAPPIRAEADVAAPARPASAGRTWSVPSLPYRAELALMLAPYLLGLLGLIALPVALTFSVAFTDFDALTPPRWTGLENFRRMLDDGDFWNGLRASLVFVAVAVPLRLLGALALAMLLYRRGPGVGATQAAVYLPTIVPDVAYALLWLYIFNPLFGPLNGLMVLFTGSFDLTLPGHSGPTGWLLHPTAAQAAIVLMLIWTIGEGFVLLMAALQDIPRELYDSAAIDGAGARQRFMLVTLPMLAPFLLLLAFRDTVWSFQANFVAAVIVTKGGPYYATSYLPYWIYLNAADYQRFGYAAAMMLVMFAITAAIILLQFGVSRRWRTAYYA